MGGGKFTWVKVDVYPLFAALGAGISVMTYRLYQCVASFFCLGRLGCCACCVGGRGWCVCGGEARVGFRAYAGPF